MLNREELAKEVLAMFALQRAYFRLKPGDPLKYQALEASKKSEQELKAECERLLVGPSLFGDGP